MHTHITDPFSAGYLGYLACIASWLRVADEIVVVDGGSRDGSIEMLHDWVGRPEHLRVVSPAEAYWGAGDQWCFPQIAINRQIGFSLLGTDWAIHVDADYMAPDLPARAWREELVKHREATVLSVPAEFYHNGRFVQRRKPRAWIVNRRAVVERGLKIGYGMSEGGLDYPIFIEKWSMFLDPVTGMDKRYAVGREVGSQGAVRPVLFSMGHFFFTEEQCLAKCMRLNRAVARFARTFPRTLFETRLRERFHRICGRESRAELLAKPFPVDMLRLIRQFYREEMLGGALYRPPDPFEEACLALVAGALRGARKAVQLAAGGLSRG